MPSGDKAQAQVNPGWGQSIGAQRPHDPLLECLVALSRLHGQPRSHDALSVGLPLVNNQLTPSLFSRAARRAGLASKITRRPLTKINSALFPVVLLLKDHNACLLVGWEKDGKIARVILPELGEASVTMPLDELEASYTGLAILSHPQFQFDARAPEVGKLRHRHWFWGAMLENLPVYRDVLMAAALINTFALALPMFTMNVYNRVIPNHAVETLWMLAIGLAIILAADFSLRVMRGYFVDLAGKRVDVSLSTRIMEHVLGTRLEHRPVSVGSFASNLRSFEVVRDFITSATVTALIDLPFAFLFVLVMAWVDLPMMIPPLIGMAIVSGYGFLIQGKMHELAESTYRAGAMRNAGLVESLVGLETLKAIGAEGPMQRKWERSAVYLAKVSAQLRLLAATSINSAMWVQQLVTLSVIIIGVYRIGLSELSMGGLIACSMLSSRAMAPFGQVAGLLTNYHNATTALESLDNVMGKEVERPADANFVSRPHFKGEIEFKEAGFTYPGSELESLRNISLRIRAGERVGIIGRVGSGKSTLLKLILGLYQPTSGAVRVDGVDIRQLDPAELRRNVGYIPQDGVLFFGSLRENIALAAPAVTDGQLLGAADIGGLSDMINAHPRGFDMLIGERGESLSGGQRQGVAIARGVINEPPIILLDEPTSSMDHSSEELVKAKMRQFCANRTLLIVTHRTSLLDLVDRLIVMDNGKIVADGPKERVVEALKQGRIEKAS
jgi:ATP-binding cassette subfamily C protein LapB